MGVSTKAIIRKGVTIEQIENAIDEKYQNVTVETSKDDDLFYVHFKDGEDVRKLAVIFDYNGTERDYGISGAWLSFGFWGNSVDCRSLYGTPLNGYWKIPSQFINPIKKAK